jgi:hypothetical protein
MTTTKQVTIAELRKEVSARRGLKHIRYGVFIRPFLPTTEGHGFSGCALVTVSKKDFLRAAERLLENLEARGAKIELDIPTADFECFSI